MKAWLIAPKIPDLTKFDLRVPILVAVTSTIISDRPKYAIPTVYTQTRKEHWVIYNQQGLLRGLKHRYSLKRC